MRFSLFGAAIACALISQIGCMTPLGGSAQEHRADSAASVAGSTAEDLAREPGSSRPESDGNLASVLDTLQQVRAIDPTAEQKLIDELRQVPSPSWPLVAEQFRASLAYRQQLAARNPRPGTASGADLAGSAPSAPVGSLVDPRGTEIDQTTAETTAQSMHLAMQAPPDTSPRLREFRSDGPAHPLEATRADAGEGATDRGVAIQQAAFESGSTLGRAERSRQLREYPSSESDAGEYADSWQELVARAADDLNDRVAESPSTTAEVHQHVSLRLLRLLEGDTERALEPIPHLSPVAQDYWSKQIFALATYLDHHTQPDDHRRAAASVTHLDEAVSHLRELGTLSLRNFSFCKNVYGYGAIEPYQDERFKPGDEVALYVEVENYHSKSTEDGYCTLLGSSYELLNEDNERLVGGEFPDVDDCCRTRRRDFHIQYGLALPRSLSPGRYRLQLVVKDRQSDKIGQASVGFEIVGGSTYRPKPPESDQGEPDNERESPADAAGR